MGAVNLSDIASIRRHLQQRVLNLELTLSSELDQAIEAIDNCLYEEIVKRIVLATLQTTLEEYFPLTPELRLACN